METIENLKKLIEVKNAYKSKKYSETGDYIEVASQYNPNTTLPKTKELYIAEIIVGYRQYFPEYLSKDLIKQIAEDKIIEHLYGEIRDKLYKILRKTMDLHLRYYMLEDLREISEELDNLISELK